MANEMCSLLEYTAAVEPTWKAEAMDNGDVSKRQEHPTGISQQRSDSAGAAALSLIDNITLRNVLGFVL